MERRGGDGPKKQGEAIYLMDEFNFKEEKEKTVQRRRTDSVELGRGVMWPGGRLRRKHIVMVTLTLTKYYGT